MKTTQTHPHGLIAYAAIQCTHPETGETGDWLYTGSSHREQDSAVSPVFPDLIGLFNWARENHWVSYGPGFVYEA
jgi:hypothetical protein